MKSRMFFHAGAIGALCFNALPVLAAKDGPTVLEPIGPWQLDMAENNCRMARAFGTENDKTLLLLEQWDPSARLSWTIAGGATKDFKSRRSAAFAFGPNGDADRIDFMPSTFGDYGAAIRSSSSVVLDEDGDASDDRDEREDRDYGAEPRGLPQLDADAAEGITHLDIGKRTPDDVRLNLGDMKKPLEAMNVCMANLVEHWGFDVEEQRRVVQPPKPRNMQLVVREIIRAYPSEAVGRSEQADFHVRVTVGADGDVKDCVLLNQTVATSFDQPRDPCYVFTRKAEFAPATDASGKPVPSYFTTRVLYRIGS